MSTFAQWSVDVEILKHLAAQEADLIAKAAKVKSERHKKIALMFKAGAKVKMSDGSFLIITKTDGDTVHAISPAEHSTRSYGYLNLIPANLK